MTAELQTWVALGIVAIAATWLIWRWWTRRGHEHEGCDCPGARSGGELAKLKKRVRRN